MRQGKAGGWPGPPLPAGVLGSGCVAAFSGAPLDALPLPLPTTASNTGVDEGEVTAALLAFAFDPYMSTNTSR